jgi:hypothetical protein
MYLKVGLKRIEVYAKTMQCSVANNCKKDVNSHF